ncbi:Topoisomerase 1-related TRF4 [Hyphodiscus hymeniophilus]|uniref:polynucleotide adenylyltransferase n=1 Tax=Hyphodiscus hymeniophilus TaxID=353542 RepID=A0A9P6VKZ1_9HELO|nr:Topoisomerase 1-related TRF4 [Hyphodiscus hymeniophilus]
MSSHWTPINTPTSPKMSRLPPLPPGLPPRPVDSYRPGQDRNDRFESRDFDVDRRERDRDRPPMYHFGGINRRSPPRDNRSYDRYNQNDRYAPGTAPPALRPSSSVYRPSYNQGPPPPSRDFNFRQDAPPAIFAAKDNMYQPPTQQPRRNNDFKQNSNGSRQGRRGAQSEGRGGYRGRYGPRMASEREFLQGNREPTPEQMPGMDVDENGVRFKPMDDMSDSEEAEMDMSEGENAVAEQPTKKARTTSKAADGDSVPRWSNPDPYTALPPPDESQRKKKDVVKLIRKARVEATAAIAAKVDPADDFISFDLGDETEDAESPPPDKSNSGAGVVGAPTGPRFSHNANLHKQPPPSVPAAALSTRVSNKQVQVEVQPQTLLAQTNNQNVSGRVNNQNVRAPLSKQMNQDRADHNGQRVGNENLRFDISVSKVVPTTAKVGRKPINLDTTSDPALGSRKRNILDEIKPAPLLHKSGKFVSRKPGSGDVLKEWHPKHGVSSTPWLDIDHSDTANMGLWLHKEVMDFYNYVRPRDFESVIRTRLVDDLRSKLKNNSTYSDTDIRPFGSFPAGLYLPTADMDLVLVSDRYMRGGRPDVGQSNTSLRKFGAFIEREGLNIPGSLEIIFGARVPLVKYVDRLTGLKVDISFENTTGIVANQTFQNWKAEFPAMPILVTLIKHLLSMRGLNEPVSGGIGGFSVTCLVVSLLQTMPQVQSRTMVAEHHLGEILMEFFDLYGHEFNTSTTAIQVDRPGYVSKSQTGLPYNAKNIGRLSIIDPNNSSNDVSGGSSNTPTIVHCFSQTYRALQNRMSDLNSRVPAARREESILGCILAGNYTSFRLQREHLAHVYEKLYGPVEID